MPAAKRFAAGPHSVIAFRLRVRQCCNGYVCAPDIALMADSEGGVTSRPPALKKEDALIQTAIVLAQKTKALQISEGRNAPTYSWVDSLQLT